MIFIRASLFNLVFYLTNFVAVFLCLPFLLLPRKKFVIFVNCYTRTMYWIEKFILGLDYEVRGLEYLPENGPYIIAAKHQSQYETFKLHMLFKDPAIVLKQELLNIPLWGRFLASIDPIAIDRSQRKEAMKQIVEGAHRVKEQKRPIVIFPQGTRVHPWQSHEDKPYRNGVARIAKATEMTVIPMALNSGMYWPRKGWIKYPGKVVFSFLPPLKIDEVELETTTALAVSLEQATRALQDEALAEYKYLKEPKKPAQNKS